MKEYATTLNHEALKEFAKKVGVKGYTKYSKSELLNQVEEILKNRFVEVGNTLGKPGKEGVAKVVWDQKDGVHRIKKQFRKTKSPNTLQKEATFQSIASEHGLAPKILEVNLEEKYIIMAMMGRKTLVDIISENEDKGRPLLSIGQQNEIIELFKKFDRINLFHGDPNPLNIMRFPKTKRFGMIDYGFSKKIEGSPDLRDYNGKPNECLMLVGLLVILKKRGYKASSFPIFYKNLNPTVRVQFDLS